MAAIRSSTNEKFSFLVLFIILIRNVSFAYVVDTKLAEVKIKCKEFCKTFYQAKLIKSTELCHNGCELGLLSNGLEPSDCKNLCRDHNSDGPACMDGCAIFLAWYQTVSFEKVHDLTPIAENSDQENDEVLTEVGFKSLVEDERMNRQDNHIPISIFRNLPVSDPGQTKPVSVTSLNSYFDLNFIISVTALQFCFILIIFLIIRTNETTFHNILFCSNSHLPTDTSKNILLDDVDNYRTPETLPVLDVKTPTL